MGVGDASVVLRVSEGETDIYDVALTAHQERLLFSNAELRELHHHE